MIDQLIAYLQQFLLEIFRYPWIVVVLLAALPIVEARLAIPMAIAYGYRGFTPFLLGFVGSTLLAPLLLVVLIPLIKWLASVKPFKKLGEVLYEKFSDKSKSVDKDGSSFKKMLGVFVFVAIPLPLTGVWTGCAVASLVGLSYPKALLSVSLGNVVACTILSILCALFSATVINYIITGMAIVAVVIVLVLLIKALTHKSKNGEEKSEKVENSDEV